MAGIEILQITDDFNTRERERVLTKYIHTLLQTNTETSIILIYAFIYKWIRLQRTIEGLIPAFLKITWSRMSFSRCDFFFFLDPKERFFFKKNFVSTLITRTCIIPDLFTISSPQFRGQL